MTESVETFQPDWVSHPGETVADLLDERGWSQVELAARTGFTRKHINELVAGKAPLSPETALKLEATIGGTVRFWLAREAHYREGLLRKSSELALSSQTDWLRELPVIDMVRFGWIKRAPTLGSQVGECLRFFGVATVDAWREKYMKPLAAFRSSQAVTKKVGAIAAWLRQGEREATAAACGAFDEARFRQLLSSEIRKLTRESNPAVFVPRLLAMCAQTGVATVFVRAPKGCPAYGATRWVSSDRAILQLSLRYKTNDHLWFTFFHEAGHIVLHGRQLFIEGAGAIDNEHEDEADRFASDVLIPPEAAVRLPTIPRTNAAVSQFAASIGIPPGVVVGRMQREKLLPWTHLNGLKVSYEWGSTAEL